MKAKMFLLLARIKLRFFKTCPKTGRIYGVRKETSIQKIVFIAVGIASMLWFLFRVIPKPSRATYPCMQAAAPIAFTFVGFISTMFLSAFGFRKALFYVKSRRFTVAILCLVLATGSILTNLVFLNKDVFAQTGVSNGKFTPIDKPNTPIGVPDGIFPGRVTWVHDPGATSWDGTSNFWWSTVNNNQAAISNMMIKAVNNISGGTTTSKSWDLLFKNLNKKKGKGNVGFKAGEKIVIKINLNSEGSNHGTNNWLDASPQTVYALLSQLVNSVGVAQENICVYDAIRNTGMDVVINYCSKDFPNVSYQN